MKQLGLTGLSWVWSRSSKECCVTHDRIYAWLVKTCRLVFASQYLLCIYKSYPLKDKKLQFRKYCSSFLRVASSWNENTLFRRCEFASALLWRVTFFILLSIRLDLAAYRSSSTISAINHVVLSSPVRYSCNYRNTSNALCSESLYSSVVLYTKKQVINLCFSSISGCPEFKKQIFVK